MGKRTKDVSRRDFVRQAGMGAAALAVASSSPLRSLAEAEVKNGMTYTTLGRTGLKISEVILGAGPMNPGRANLLRAALSQGVNYIDTASGYQNGQSETAVGQVVEAMGNRDKLVIASKASAFNHRKLVGAQASQVEKALRENLEGSLERLQTDYVDIYFCPHGADAPEQVAFPALQEAMDKLKEEGKIRFTAISTHTRYDEVSQTAVDSGYYDVIMPVISPTTLIADLGKAAVDSYSSQPEPPEGAKRRRRRRGRPILQMREIIRAAQKKNLGLVAMKAANDGFNPKAIHDLA
ncbi:MAG: aldo/keto reductase, partial [Candidatus Latescibacteria bacterium]|nr:aldo/keto reductase [Candidatus Latescibacterota bacterium]